MSSVAKYEDPLLSDLGWGAVVLISGLVGRTWDLKAEDLGLNPVLAVQLWIRPSNSLNFCFLVCKINENSTYCLQNDSKDKFSRIRAVNFKRVILMVSAVIVQALLGGLAAKNSPFKFVFYF